jgi:hypothetical protein
MARRAPMPSRGLPTDAIFDEFGAQRCSGLRPLPASGERLVPAACAVDQLHRNAHQVVLPPTSHGAPRSVPGRTRCHPSSAAVDSIRLVRMNVIKIAGRYS